MKKILLFALLLTFNSYAKDGDAKKVVAEVNGVKISLKRFKHAYNQRLLFVSNKRVNKKAVLDDLINRELGVAKAKKEKIDRDPAVREKINDLMYNAQVSKDLAPELKKIKVTEDDVKNYYNKNKEYRTAHILYRVRANPSKEELQKALQESVKIYNLVVKNPKEFSQIAQKFSQTNVAHVGGDLGYQPPTRYAPEYFAEIRGKKVGYISKPVRTQYGYHIIKILGIKPYDKINKNVYKKIVYDIKRDKIIDQYHISLRNKAKIKIDESIFK